MNKDNNNKKRHFKCIFNGKTFGRFSGKTPKQAANKALTSIIKGNGGNNECIGKNYNFMLRECTRGKPPKEKQYSGVRTKLDRPITIQLKQKNNLDTWNRSINFNYINKVKHIPIKNK